VETLKFKLGQETKDLRLGLTDPYFLGYRYSAGVDLYRESRSFDTYSYEIMGGDIRWKGIEPELRLDLLYKLETVNVYDVTDDASYFVMSRLEKN